MGKGSLLEKHPFVTRHEVANQRSYLHDHVGYFQNRLGFLSVLWLVLAGYSRLPLFDHAARCQLERAEHLHRRRAWLLWFGGLFAWTGAAVGLIAMRDHLAVVGAALGDALDGLGLGAIATAAQTVGRVVANLLSGLSIAWLRLDADNAGLALLTCLSLVLGAAAWRALFKAVWRLGGDACWRKACRRRDWLGAFGWTLGDVAGSLIWGTFALVPMAIALPLVFMPGDLLLARIGLGTGIALACACALIATIYAGAAVWVMDRPPGDEAMDVLERVALPVGAFVVILIFLSAARWLWPDAAKPGAFSAVELTVWALMAASAIVWILARGWHAYGLPGLTCLLLSLAAGVLLLGRWMAPSNAVDRLLMFDAVVLSVLTLAQAVRERRALRPHLLSLLSQYVELIPYFGPVLRRLLENDPAGTWLATCSCGWDREASSEWAANAVSRLHRQLGDVGVEHVTHVEAPNDAKGGDQLTLV
jgi:hypothetical protein